MYFRTECTKIISHLKPLRKASSCGRTESTRTTRGSSSQYSSILSTVKRISSPPSLRTLKPTPCQRWICFGRAAIVAQCSNYPAMRTNTQVGGGMMEWEKGDLRTTASWPGTVKYSERSSSATPSYVSAFTPSACFSTLGYTTIDHRLDHRKSHA